MRTSVFVEQHKSQPFQLLGLNGESLSPGRNRKHAENRQYWFGQKVLKKKNPSPKEMAESTFVSQLPSLWEENV